MSAHHYFRNFAYCDSGMIPWLLVAELISVSRCSLSQLVGQRMAAFPCSGEINYMVQDVQSCIDAVKKHLQNKITTHHLDTTDGLSMEFADWHFNLRGSNTEPLLRFNMETYGGDKALQQHVAEIAFLIQECG